MEVKRDMGLEPGKTQRHRDIGVLRGDRSFFFRQRVILAHCVGVVRGAEG